MPRTRFARRHPRVAAQLPVLVRVLGEPAGEHAEQLTRTRTVGLGGCMFVSEEPPGYLALLELLISVEGLPMRVDGRVAYTRPVRQGCEVGVEFLRVSPADRNRLAALVTGAA